MVKGAVAAAGIALAAIAVVGALARRTPADRARVLPDFRMTAVTKRGRTTLGRGELLGRPWIADFIFTRCGGPCPLLSAQMARLQRELPREVRLISFTVDPDADTPEALQDYAARFGADPDRWMFLRGEKAGLYRLMYEGFNLPLAENPGAAPGAGFIHSTRFVLVDAEGAVHGYYDGNDEDAVVRLETDAKRLAKERS
jgi:protein SCO1/2